MRLGRSSRRPNYVRRSSVAAMTDREAVCLLFALYRWERKFLALMARAGPAWRVWTTRP